MYVCGLLVSLATQNLVVILLVRSWIDWWSTHVQRHCDGSVPVHMVGIIAFESLTLTIAIDRYNVSVYAVSKDGVRGELSEMYAARTAEGSLCALSSV